MTSPLCEHCHAPIIPNGSGWKHSSGLVSCRTQATQATLFKMQKHREATESPSRTVGFQSDKEPIADGSGCQPTGEGSSLPGPGVSRFGILRKNLGTLLPLFFPFILASFIFLGSILQSGRILVKRELAPLRRIVSRELVTFQPDARGRYYIYSLRDRLECGHESDQMLFNGLRDLLFAYSENPVVRARRHRCGDCASLIANKKPIQSVAALAVRKVSA